MTIQERKKSLISLGKFLAQFNKQGSARDNRLPHNDLFFDAVNQIIDRSYEQNSWFTKPNVRFALASWADALQENKINKWFEMYSMSEQTNIKTVGVIMAGNIPLVGFHDFITILMSGHKIKAKLSSNDKVLLPMLAKYLTYVEPKFKEYIEFVDGALKDIDKGKIVAGSKVVCTLTGHGLKDPDTAIKQSTRPLITIDATLDAVSEAILSNMES
jgi:hypothetical protein